VENLNDYKEIIEVIKLSGGDAFKRCFQCGLCDAVCPWNRVTDFSMRKMVRQAVLGMTEIESEDLWRCTTCGRCPQRCPRDVQQIASGVALRRLATEYGVFPASAKPIRTISGSLTGEGNPLSEDRGDRAKWAEGLGVESFSEEHEILYFPGCYLAYDPRLKKVAKATVEILKAAGVSFGILGSKENCCGESIRKTGDEELFKRLARENIKTFIDNGVNKILVNSPHCYHTFKNEYPEFRVDFEVIHITELVASLISQGRISLEKEFAKKVVYHDPCYLGRHNEVYQPPRDILKAVAGLEYMELADSFFDSLCCGGGGGRIWMETPKDERFSDIRIKQAVEAGAEVLATSCPYCITNFEDSRLNLEVEESIQVMDITEIVQQAL